MGEYDKSINDMYGGAEKRFVPKHDIDTRFRNNFQGLIIETMVSKDPELTEFGWIHKYGSVISSIIDNPKNKKIRKAISSGNFETVKDRVIEMLKSGLTIDDNEPYEESE